jgi:hypothetical protein
MPRDCEMNQIDTKLLGIVSQGRFVPIHFQEKCAVTV